MSRLAIATAALLAAAALAPAGALAQEAPRAPAQCRITVQPQQQDPLYGYNPYAMPTAPNLTIGGLQTPLPLLSLSPLDCMPLLPPMSRQMPLPIPPAQMRLEPMMMSAVVTPAPAPRPAPPRAPARGPSMR